MNAPQAQLAPVEIGIDPQAVDLRRITRRSTLDPDRRLRCVSSGYLSHGHSCEHEIPLAAVRAAWARERAGAFRDGFFRFTFNDRVWLAFGLADGHIRGVYCPEHAAERDRRSYASATAAGVPPSFQPA